MVTLIDDLRFALRSYLKTPAFTLVAVLTIALGTGVNATVFTFVSALLFRPAPVPDPDSLVSVFTSDFSSGPYGDTSYPDFRSLQVDATAFEALAAYDGGQSTLLQARESVERIRRSAVSAEFFQVLRVAPLAGRLLGAADFAGSAAPVVVISEALWRRALAASPDALSRHLSIGGRPHAVVGVLPSGFVLDLGARVDAWVPFGSDITGARRGDRNLSVVGRLRHDRTIAEAQAEVTTIAARLAHEYPESNLGTLDQRDRPRPMRVLRHTRVPPPFRGDVAMLGGVMMAGVALVLLIACANVANLLLSRAAGRVREMAVRRALGAGGGRIIGQLLTESVVLGLCGGALGMLFALWTADALPSFFPAEQAAMLDARVDATTLGYTIALSLASSVLFGMAPAVQCVRAPLGDAVRTARTPTPGTASMRIRALLVVAQVALATVLLVSAGLLGRSLLNALRADLGFATRNAVVLSVEQPLDRPVPEGLAYYQALLDRVGGLAGVDSVSLARNIPLFGTGRRGFRPDGYEFKPGEAREFHINVVSPSFFETMGIPVLAGRAFDGRDVPGGMPTAMVNDIFAARYFRGDAVGRRITDSRGTELAIVGVARTTKHLTVREQPVPLVYYPQAQEYARQATLIARTSGRAASMLDAVRRAATGTDREVAVFQVDTLEGRIAEALSSDRLAAALLAACGALALVLATVGVYAVMAFAIARRARELGVRVALGARPSQILSLVVGAGARVTALGIGLGLAAALAATRALASLLYGVAASDVATFAAVAAVLTAVIAVATLLPARRALRVDPIVVLRDE